MVTRLTMQGVTGRMMEEVGFEMCQPTNERNEKGEKKTDGKVNNG